MSKTGEKSYVLRVGIKTMLCGLIKSRLAAIGKKKGVIILLSVGTGVYIQLVSISSLAVNLTAMISICLITFFQVFLSFISQLLFERHYSRLNSL